MEDACEEEEKQVEEKNKNEQTEDINESDDPKMPVKSRWESVEISEDKLSKELYHSLDLNIY